MLGGIGANFNLVFAYIAELSPEELSHTQGGDDSFHFEAQYRNRSVPFMNYTDYFMIDYVVWINNGTAIIPVHIIAENVQSVNNSGNIHHFSLDLYEDKDGSVISAWNQDWSQFTSIDWQAYANYYIIQTQSEWTPYRDEFSNPSNWEKPGSPQPSQTNVSTDGGGDIQENGSKPEIWKDVYEGLDTGVYSPAAYDLMPQYLTGDESWWFIDIFYEKWSNEYIYQTNYTWYNMLTGELLDPTLDIYGPAEEYDEDWNMIEKMRENSSNVQLEGDWAWFSYNIDQWVAWSDPVVDSAGFAFSTFEYVGMSAFNDSNQNGIVDTYNSINPEWSQITFNLLESEQIYTLILTDINEFSCDIESSTDHSLDVGLTLHNISGIAEPSNFKFHQDELLPIAYYNPYLTIHFSFDFLNTNSSLAIKHNIGSFLSNASATEPIPEFANLSLSCEYTLNSPLYSSLIYLANTVPSEFQSNSSSITEDLYLITNSSEEFTGFLDSEPSSYEETTISGKTADSATSIMTFNLISAYTNGFMNGTGINTAIISPVIDFMHTPDIATPGMAAVYASKASSFYYSLCFPLWGGYSLEMDPTLTSCFSFYQPLVKPFKLPNWVWSFLALPVIILFVLIMTKEEYRSFLLNRVLQYEAGPHRLSIEDVLENQNRSQVIDLIFEQPGIHYNELLRQSGLSPGNLTWHIEILERYRIIKSEILGKYVVYYPYYEFYEKNPLAHLDLTLAKSKTTMDILQLIQTTPALTQSEVAKRLEKDHKTIKYHLDKLIEANLITKRKIGKTNLLYPTITEEEE